MPVTFVDLHHADAGDGHGVPLVLGGSLGTTLAMWDPQIGPLAAGFRVIAYDHRGHGASPAPRGPYAIDDLGRDVLGLLDRVGIRRASYCGLSLGGMVGMWLAANAPGRVDRLVLICTSAHLPPESGYLERAVRVRAAGTVETIADAVLARWFTPGFTREHPEVVARHRAMLAATPAEGYAGCCEAIATLDLRASLSAVSAPTLVIAGAEDPATPPVHARAIVDAIPGARLEVLDHAAHLASVEQAAEVTKLIADHLKLPEAS